ncbi:MAG: hypothetical protein VBE63_14620 [Lamprobacter sp.]|uniref:hypothetical protein n=1 Tax=Lamprobacter sp. TaxID=3100796 RepID=UPI002B25A3E7|nr:hypothetical protein [Lamprobacter sp.]MEA3641157.1 hypothetical protein [Lamprobacter sp.]
MLLMGEYRWMALPFRAVRDWSKVSAQRHLSVTLSSEGNGLARVEWAQPAIAWMHTFGLLELGM